MEKIQRDVSHNHRLVPGPELEEKALVLKQLGETLTELKGEASVLAGGQASKPASGMWSRGGSPCCTPTPQTLPSLLPFLPILGSCSLPSSLFLVPSAHFPGLQSKMRVVLRVEVEAVKFLKEEPQRLDGLLKRCRGVTDMLAQIRRSFSP